MGLRERFYGLRFGIALFSAFCKREPGREKIHGSVRHIAYFIPKITFTPSARPGAP